MKSLSNAPAMPPTVRIALVSDTHFRTDDTEAARKHLAHFGDTVAQVNAALVDIVLIAGDCTESGTPDQYDAFDKGIKNFNAPVRMVPGNHDVGGKHLPAKPGEGVTQKRVNDWEARFGPSWSVMVGGVRFVGINTSVLGSGLPAEADQWALLERELVAAAHPAQTTVLVQHYPLFSKEPDEAGGDYWNLEPAPRARFLALLAKNPCAAVLSGHLHRPLQADWHGIRLVTTPPVSFGLPTGKQAEGWTLLTVSPQNGKVSTEFHAVRFVPAVDPPSSPKPATEKKS